MKLNFHVSMVAFLAFRHCQAAGPVVSDGVPAGWTQVGCKDWTFTGLAGSEPANIDQIWSNARAMVANTLKQIDKVPTTRITKKLIPGSVIAGANAVFMFGIPWDPKTGTNNDGDNTLKSMKATYTGIQQGLEDKLTGTSTFNLQTATKYIFCEGKGFTKGTIPGAPFGSDTPAYYYKTQGADGVTKYIVPRIYIGAQQAPCTEKEAYAGKTFDTYYIETPPAPPLQPGQTPPPPPAATVTETYVGIILCPNQWKELDDEDERTGPPIMRPILAPNFAVTADKNVNEYWSASGTLIHEMAHVYGRSLGQTWEDTPAELTSTFNPCVALAKTNPARSIINPDSYRIFAEMSMSPATQWQAPPKQQSKKKPGAPAKVADLAGPANLTARRAY